jgi:hypothetical protein
MRSQIFRQIAYKAVRRALCSVSFIINHINSIVKLFFNLSLTNKLAFEIFRSFSVVLFSLYAENRTYLCPFKNNLQENM